MEYAREPDSQRHVTAADPFSFVVYFSPGYNKCMILRLCNDAFGFMYCVVSSGRMVE